MATESLPNHKEGVLDEDTQVLEYVASEALTLWSPVALVAAGTGEDMPRVTFTANLADPTVIGVVVDRKR